MSLSMGREAASITLLICTLNEADNIAQVLSQVPDIVSEILIVDGHSADGTVVRAHAASPKARIVTQPGMGKGDAIRYGIQEAKGDIIVTLDADGSMDPTEIPRFIQPLMQGHDWAKASRFLPGAGTMDMPKHRRFANSLFTCLVNILYRAKYTDITYGYNAFWRNGVSHINVRSNGFEEIAEWLIKIHKAGLRVTEVPSFEHPRLHGRGKLRSLPDGVRILRTILRERFHKF